MRKKYSLQNHRRIKHSMQAFADRAADDFGITQREVLERTDRQMGRHILPYAESIGLGTTKYELIEL